jgi:D-alanyl-lipoteichoic acid acyltransferase DltB (MBOAT superfamily)
VWFLANLAFFATFAKSALQALPYVVLLAFAFASIGLARRIERTVTFAVLLAANGALFCLFKRYVFVPTTALLPFDYVTVGMSYVFFRLVHLLVDAFEGTLPQRLGPIEFVNYTLNFTSFVAGPIQLYGDYARCERPGAISLGRADVARALERILTGFFKVTILSASLGFVHDRALDALLAVGRPDAVGVLCAAVAVGVFPVSLYANFSGYTDVAIGVARFMRLELPENFNKPFAATGFIDFWGRWHMSLSAWVKTYVYSPLVIALMRRVRAPRLQPFLAVAGYFITFFLVGLWHGQSAMFVVFGVLLGAGAAINKLFTIAMTRRVGWKRYEALSTSAPFLAGARALTYAWFAFASIWFWASPDQLGRAAGSLGIAAACAALAVVVLAAVPALAATRALDAAVRAVRDWSAGHARGVALRAAWNAMLFALLLSANVLQAPAPQIVYRAF